MARPKQTAKKSTGGKAPRTALSIMAARVPVGTVIPEIASQITLIDGIYQIRRPGGGTEDILEADAELRLGPEVIHWLQYRHGRVLTQALYQRWSLDEWRPSSRDSESSSSTSSDQQMSNLIDPYSVRLVVSSQDVYEANTPSNKGAYFPVIFCSLFSGVGNQAQAAKLDLIDNWCIKNPGKSYVVATVGNRNGSKHQIPQAIRSTVLIKFRTTTEGCGLAAIANLIDPRDGKQAQILFQDAIHVEFRGLRTIARWMESNTMFQLRRVPVDTESSKTKLQYLLGQTTGLYVVVISDKDGSEMHAIGVDGHRCLVYDSVEESAMVLSHEAFDRSSGGRGIVRSELDIRQVWRKNAKARRKTHRISK
jgi:hypothetical protein